MSYSIIRVEKIKSKTNTTGIQKHVQRENKNYENPDINFEKTYLNYDLVNEKNINFNEKIEQKIDENYNGKRKIRSDAVKHIDGIITSDEKFFKDKSPAQVRDFFEKTKDFLEKEYGKDNLLYATVHLDEKVPHMHFGVVPLTKDGRLSAKEVLGNKKAMTEFQDRFNNFVNEHGFDMDRGTSKRITGKKRVEMNAFKQQTDYHKQQNEVIGRKMLDLSIEMDRMKEEYQEAINTLKTPVNVKYEEETRKVGLFGAEREKTGRYIMPEDEFERFNKQIQSSQKVLKQFEFMNKYDTYDLLVEERRKNKELEEKYNSLDEKFTDVLKKSTTLIHMIQKIFMALENFMGRKAYVDFFDRHFKGTEIMSFAKNIDRKNHQEIDKNKNRDNKKQQR